MGQRFTIIGKTTEYKIQFWDVQSQTVHFSTKKILLSLAYFSLATAGDY